MFALLKKVQRLHVFVTVFASGQLNLPREFLSCHCNFNWCPNLTEVLFTSVNLVTLKYFAPFMVYQWTETHK